MVLPIAGTQGEYSHCAEPEDGIVFYGKNKFHPIVFQGNNVL